MGILYNRFTAPPTMGPWELIDTFTEVQTYKPIDTTGKTEMLVVCDDIISVLFCIRDRGPDNVYSESGWGDKAYNTDTGTGYEYEITFRYNETSLQSPALKIVGRSRPSISQGTDLSSVNTKVYMR